MTASNPPALPSLTFPAVSQSGRLASTLLLILQVFFSIWSSFPSQSVYLAQSQRGLISLDRSDCLPPSALQLHPRQRLTPSCKHEVGVASVSLTSDTSAIYQQVSSVVIRYVMSESEVILTICLLSLKHSSSVHSCRCAVITHRRRTAWATWIHIYGWITKFSASIDRLDSPQVSVGESRPWKPTVCRLKDRTLLDRRHSVLIRSVLFWSSCPLLLGMFVFFMLLPTTWKCLHLLQFSFQPRTNPGGQKALPVWKPGLIFRLLAVACRCRCCSVTSGSGRRRPVFAMSGSNRVVVNLTL